MIFLWIYLSGLFVTFVLCIILSFKMWYDGENITLEDLGLVWFVVALSYIGFSITLYWLFDEYKRTVLIKGRSRNNALGKGD